MMGSSPSLATLLPASTLTSFVDIDLAIPASISGPGGRQARYMVVGFNEAKVFLFGDGLTKLAQNVVIYVSALTTALEKCFSMYVACGRIFSRKKICAN
jgi:hypothetical protein